MVAITAAHLAGLADSPLVRSALRSGAFVLAVLLFLLSLRRSGEGVGRIAERLETTEKANEIKRRMLDAAAAVLVIATSWLTGFATAGFEARWTRGQLSTNNQT
jgi:predicted ABC-type sugar transport system permease subunit